MAFSPNECLPVSVFARAMGVDPKAIHRYIETGKIYGEAVEFKTGKGREDKVKGIHLALGKAQFQAARDAAEIKYRRSGSNTPGINTATGLPAAGRARMQANLQELAPNPEAELDALLALDAMPDGPEKEAAILAAIGRMDSAPARVELTSDYAPSITMGAATAAALGPGKRPAASEAASDNPGKLTMRRHRIPISEDFDPAPWDGTRDRTADQNEVPESDPKAIQKKNLSQLAMREAELKVEKAEIDLAKMKGEFINRNDVYRALFVAGQTLRIAMEGVPERVIDHIIAAADNRTEALNLLAKEINTALAGVASLGELKITTERAPARSIGTR